MKKRITMILALGTLLSLCACGNPASESNNANPESRIPVTSDGSKSFVSETGNETGSGTENDTENGTRIRNEFGSGTGFSNGTEPGSDTGTGNRTEHGNDTETTASGSLSLLYMLQGHGKACAATDSGCYYLSNEDERLPDGRYASHLMYMDLATRQEIYLCNNAACAHNTADCTSVFLNEDFPPYTTALFVWNGNLYIMGKEQDHDGGSSTTEVFGGDSIGIVPTESRSIILYRADPDGTNRDKVYTFDPNVTVEDFVVGDADGLYLITKKLTTQQGSGNIYHTSSERKLIYLDLSSKTERAVCSMDFGDNISWDVISSSGRTLILYGIDFGRYVSPEEILDDDFIKMYDDSYDVFAALNVDDGSLRELYRVYAPKARSYEVDGNKLYFAAFGSGSIVSVDLRTGEEATLCTIAKNSIGGVIGDRLYCYDNSDHTYRFVDVNTGEISHSGLVNKTTGWSLSFIAEFGDQVLVNYDTDGFYNSDGSFSPTGEHYGLIRKEDLYAGIDNFAPINMTGKGMR